MKKTVTLVVVGVAVLAVVALMLFVHPNGDNPQLGGEQTQSGGNQTNNNGNNNSQESSNEHTGKKISGKITSASVFSEGLAFVCIDGNKEKAYCVNKQGYIVFEVDAQIPSFNGEILTKFVNGFAFWCGGVDFVNGAICDSKGEITRPEDVGTTAFFGFALNGGYIVATRITADYNSAKKELGVMNTKFEWILQPSEQLYNELGKDLSSALFTGDFCANDYLYFDGCKKYLNVNTGEVSDAVNVQLPSETWLYYTDNTFRNTNEEIMLSLNHLDNIEGTKLNTYKNGKIPVTFFNPQVGKRFWTLIDENGAFLFDPIEMEGFDGAWSVFHWVKFDGEYTVFYNDSSDKLSSYNSKGELVGELELDISTGYVENGVILLITGGLYSKECHYYNADFTPLLGA